MLNVHLPEFNLQAFNPTTNAFLDISNNTMSGQWSLFFFYPADFTFVCPTELEDLAQIHDQLKTMGVLVYGVSTDTHFVHKAWFDASETIKKVNYPLIGDPAHVITRGLGVLRPNGLAERATFVFSPTGELVILEVTSEGVGRNAEELLRKIKAAQYTVQHPNEACPAKWKEGGVTLKPSLDLVGKI